MFLCFVCCLVEAGAFYTAHACSVLWEKKREKQKCCFWNSGGSRRYRKAEGFENVKEGGCSRQSWYEYSPREKVMNICNSVKRDALIVME